MFNITQQVVLISQAVGQVQTMKLSRKSDYALRALMTLVERFGQGPVSIRELAEINDVPRRFLEHIMLEMKAKGWVNSIAGRIGGFELAKRPEEISMGQIVRHFDGLLAPIGCVSVSNYEKCSQEMTCRFRRILLEIRNYTSRLMDEANLAEVFGSAPVTQLEVFSAAFIGGDGI
ncbi:MAG: Rrf2 family transcriptional regulator [Planctomycetales bacterium]|nr:Rrf2 family transcriptional regulator [Planctomycetales bacterium]